MEKKKLTQEMLDKINPGGPIADAGFAFVQDHLPYSELEKAAGELIDNVLLLDPLGIVYEHYSFPLESCYVVLKYLTDVDVGDFDKDILFARFGQMCDEEQYKNHNIQMLYDIYYRMKDIIARRYEREHSFDYKLAMFVDGLSQQSSSEAKAMGDRLIDLLSKVKEADEQTPAPVLTMFAKKD